MIVPSPELVLLVTADGKVPFEAWFNSLPDRSFQIAVDARLTRIADGNFGDHKSVGMGVFELRVRKGPGLRIYYGIRRNRFVILIGGGDKSTQTKDIRIARELWKEYLDAS